MHPHSYMGSPTHVELSHCLTLNWLQNIMILEASTHNSPCQFHKVRLVAISYQVQCSRLRTQGTRGVQLPQEPDRRAMGSDVISMVLGELFRSSLALYMNGWSMHAHIQLLQYQWEC